MGIFNYTDGDNGKGDRKIRDDFFMPEFLNGDR